MYGENTFYIPLRNNLKEVNKAYGKIGFSVPSASRKYAGLDYRYYDVIVREAKAYVNGFVKKAKKDRIEKTAKYRESSLINFRHELGLVTE